MLPFFSFLKVSYPQFIHSTFLNFVNLKIVRRPLIIKRMAGLNFCVKGAKIKPTRGVWGEVNNFFLTNPKRPLNFEELFKKSAG